MRNNNKEEENGWLVLTRAVGQGIQVYDRKTGEKVMTISVNDVRWNSVTRLGFKADERYCIIRDEIVNRHRG